MPDRCEDSVTVHGHTHRPGSEEAGDGSVALHGAGLPHPANGSAPEIDGAHGCSPSRDIRGCVIGIRTSRTDITGIAAIIDCVIRRRVSPENGARLRIEADCLERARNDHDATTCEEPITLDPGAADASVPSSSSCIQLTRDNSPISRPEIHKIASYGRSCLTESVLGLIPPPPNSITIRRTSRVAVTSKNRHEEGESDLTFTRRSLSLWDKHRARRLG